MNESRGVAGVLVLAGVLLSAHVAEGGDLSALSTPELERLVKAGDARVAAAFGKHKSVIVQGEITDPNLILAGAGIGRLAGVPGIRRLKGWAANRGVFLSGHERSFPCLCRNCIGRNRPSGSPGCRGGTSR